MRAEALSTSERSRRGSRARTGARVALVLALCWPRAGSAQTSEASAASVLYQRGQQAYQDGKFSEAATLLRGAYDLQPDPVLLYDLALACQKMGDLHGASEALERYLGEADPPDREELERRLTSYRRQLAAAEAPSPSGPPTIPASAPAAPVTPSPPPREAPQAGVHSSPMPWILIGAGVAAVGAGVGLGLLARGRHADAEQDPVQTTAADDAASARALAGGATAAFVVGGALLGAGVVWVIARGHEARSGSPPGAGTISIVVFSPTHWGVALHGL